jgi:purine-binding chemotaxis protein CheW
MTTPNTSTSTSTNTTTALATTPSSSSTPLAEQADASRLFVVFKVDGVDYALPAHEVLQMESYTGATQVPGAQPFVAGVIRLRGRVVPAIDLRARFGLPPLETPTLDSRVVVGETNGRAVALIADAAREVVRIRASEEKPPPKLVDETGFVSSIVQLDNRTILVLDFQKVIGEAATSAAASAAAAAAASAVKAEGARDE